MCARACQGGHSGQPRAVHSPLGPHGERGASGPRHFSARAARAAVSEGTAASYEEGPGYRGSPENVVSTVDDVKERGGSEDLIASVSCMSLVYI